ncbi:protein kinase [Paramarasmius palmivorus]|uniref:Protein kinase n=1 Tax=Paramarasmius palmivorus TaxID=297713 RepID=A0AAW0C9C2_9AGAR
MASTSRNTSNNVPNARSTPPDIVPTESIIASNRNLFTTDSSELAAQPVYTTTFLESTAQIGQEAAKDSVNAVKYEFHDKMLEIEEKLHRAVAFPATNAPSYDELYGLWREFANADDDAWGHLFMLLEASDQNQNSHTLSTREIGTFFSLFDHVMEGRCSQARLEKMNTTRYVQLWLLEVLERLQNTPPTGHATEFCYGTQWQFPLLLKRKPLPANPRSDTRPLEHNGFCLYHVKSDMRFDYDGFPLIICEIDSHCQQTDEQRMIIHGVCLAKLAFRNALRSVTHAVQKSLKAPRRSDKVQRTALTKVQEDRLLEEAAKKTLVVMGIYFDARGTARRYLFYHDGKETYVNVDTAIAANSAHVHNKTGWPLSECYDLCQIKDIFRLLVQLTNYRSYVKQVADEDLLPKDFWVAVKRGLCFQKKDFGGVSSQAPKSKRPRTAPEQPDLVPFNPNPQQNVTRWCDCPYAGDDDEEMGDDECSMYSEGDAESGETLTPVAIENLGRELFPFMKQLRTRGIEMLPFCDYKLPDLPHIVAARHDTLGTVVVVKLSKYSEEADIHKELSSSEFIVTLLDTIDVSPHGTLLVTPLHIPVLDFDLSRFGPVSAFMIHLLCGVSFIHQHMIAHCDIRPANLVIVSGSAPRLKILDFSLSMRTTMDALMRDFQGVTDWVAPEVNGVDLYNPILADLWATGHVVACFSNHITSSLKLISQKLMAEVPVMRLRLAENGRPTQIINSLLQESLPMAQKSPAASTPLLTTPPQSVHAQSLISP